MDSSKSDAPSAKPDEKVRWVLVPADLDDDMAEAIAKLARCCGGGAFEIWNAALYAAPQHPVALNPNGVERMRVCSPGYIGPANISVVHAGDYDALLALLDDPEFPPKHARRLIAELRGKIAELEADKKRLDFIEENWFIKSPQAEIEFRFVESWSTPGDSLREVIDADMLNEPKL